MNISNARLSFEPRRGHGALCVCFKDEREARGFAEAILQELKSIANEGLSVSECCLVTIDFGEDGKEKRSEGFADALPGQYHSVLISVPDRN